MKSRGLVQTACLFVTSVQIKQFSLQLGLNSLPENTYDKLDTLHNVLFYTTSYVHVHL